MTFLSGESIQNLVTGNNIFIDNDQNRAPIPTIKYNYCKLKIGPEAFVTTDPEVKKAELIKLNEAEEVYVESGQFGILCSEEIISMPTNLMGFISVDTDLKFRGLINVSGFHVSPGWKGRLLFTVYNAGPKRIQLRYHEEAFLLWFAHLDNKETKMHKALSSSLENIKIPSDKVNNMDGDIYSPQALAQKIKYMDLVSSRKWQAAGWALLAGICIGICGNLILNYFGKIIGPNALLKEEIQAEIKEKIVEEALKEIQQNGLKTASPPKKENPPNTSNQDNKSNK